MTDDGRATQYCFRFADAEFDEASMTLTVAGQVMAVEPRPLRVLAELLRRPNEVVTREELYDSVWDGRPTVDNVLANAITKLRKALGEQGGTRIVNVPRIGYRLTGAVQSTPVGSLPVGRSSTSFQPGMTVQGREGFQLVRALGRDGKRNVWLAAHPKTGQERVFKFAGDAASLRELQREYTLYRILRSELGERSDIVAVVDVGFSEWPYHMECEYGGVDLLEWAAEQGHLAGLARTDRLSLFADIAEAVAAAHSVGVLHKDIKPANVLVKSVQGRWQPRLTDFGSGRALDEAKTRAAGITLVGLTVTQEAATPQWAGTPMYWAPELLVGQGATVQSDVYALGLMLFQIVVGDLRRPLTTGWQREVEDELLREDIAEATEGDPQHRLVSAKLLADRVRCLTLRQQERRAQRAAQDAAEQVRRESERRRARRPWLAGGAVLVLAALAAGGWMFDQTRRALADARTEALRSTAVLDFLSHDVLRAADVSRLGSARVLTMAEVVDRAAHKASERFAGQPHIEAVVRRQLGDILTRSLSVSAAERQFERAVALLGEEAAPGRDLPLALIGWAQAKIGFYKPDEGEQLLLRARAVLPPQELTQVSEVALRYLSAQVDMLAAKQRAAEAIPIARDLLQRVDAWPQAELADRLEARQKLAELLLNTPDQRTEGERLLREINRSPYSAESVGAVTFARAEMALAKSLAVQGRVDDARQILLRVREVLTQLLGAKALHVGLVNFELADLGSDDAVAQPQQTLDYISAAEVAFAASLGAAHGYTVSARNNKTIPLLQLGRAGDALAILDEVLPWFQQRKLGDALQYYRAWALNDLGRSQEALAALDGIDVTSAAWLHTGADPHLVWKVKFERGRALVGAGRRAEGRRLLEEAQAQAQVSGGGQEWGERIRRALVRA